MSLGGRIKPVWGKVGVGCNLTHRVMWVPDGGGMEPWDSSAEPATRRQFWGPVSQRLEFLGPLEGLRLCAKALGCHWRPESRGCCNSHFRISLSGCGRLAVSQAAPSWPPGILWWQGVLCLDIFGQSFHSHWVDAFVPCSLWSHLMPGLGWVLGVQR